MTKVTAKPQDGSEQSAENIEKVEPATAADPQPKDGLAAAEAHLAQFDEDVTLLWDVKGPAKSRIARIGSFLVAPNGSPPVKLMCLAMASGTFQLFAPANIARPPAAKAEETAEAE